MRAVPTILGVIAAFLMGAALAVAVHPRPLFRELVAFLSGDSTYERCIKAGACNAAKGSQDVPPPRLRHEAPADMDRA